jgi:hypothetical protein
VCIFSAEINTKLATHKYYLEVDNFNRGDIKHFVFRTDKCILQNIFT